MINGDSATEFDVALPAPLFGPDRTDGEDAAGARARVPGANAELECIEPVS